ncbi:MAG TPA: hypothetical protein VFF89_05290 [Sphingobium sp.]|nr:hypothetical protein [Sphingobium sp.]
MFCNRSMGLIGRIGRNGRIFFMWFLHRERAALGRLRAAKAAMQKDAEIREILESRDSVVDRYSPQFQPGQIEQIDEKVLRSFLLIENNKHWSGLLRQSNRICSDMAATRAALGALVDESQPIEERTGPATEIKGLGKGIITAILIVAYPNKYGVWNNTSESGLVELDLMPEWRRGASFGVRYAAINAVLNELARELGVDPRYHLVVPVRRSRGDSGAR